MSTAPAPRQIGIVGAGVIGASWTALFLAHGFDVTVTDPDPQASERLRRDIHAHWPSLERRGLVVPGADPDGFTFAPHAAAAADGADFVQENGPERLDVKLEVFRELDASAGPDVVIASSSSGLLATELQRGCTRQPERVVIGHPFSPPHLIPLVEVVGGELTSQDAIATALALYREVGKAPIHVRVELPGHVTNRLQAALWREAYSLVEQGACTVADIDQAIASGPGLRWALLGPFVTQHLSGGAAGLAHVLEHLGPPMEAWWADFQTPVLTDDLRRSLVAGVDAELAGLDQAAMLTERDGLLEDLLVAKRSAVHLPGADT